ncbi:uncharacterized protein LOC121242993 [Juglans microcarpa x Juglans regia]|uniref:uncharacterized protein LOC121242993 n=1 Tax=Juglans microcarpa x Juglans regia TaxID=2249226 RepID=UPI001B7F3D69|nr:uncharacterized protein LOC121242993 [Juglans microcarpa x Juglans regia]
MTAALPLHRLSALSSSRSCHHPHHTTTLNCLSSFPPNSKQALFPKPRDHQPFRIHISRRDAASLSFLALVPFFSPVAPPASAFSIGISGPKDWLKEQKRKASKFLLAPIDASRESLRSAYLLLTAVGSEYTNEDLEKVQGLLRSAARDCVPQDRNSIVSFQASTGVEVCTFRLVVKNAASLLDNKDPVKLEAEAILSDLIRSFTSLNGLAGEADIQVASNRQNVAAALMDTISCLDKFEQGIKECLEV